jgi:hypothetical protein
MPHLYTRAKGLLPAQRLVLALYPPTKEQWNTTQYTYKYELVSIPEQVDPVLEGMRATIRDIQCESFECGAGDIKVKPLTWSPPLWPYTKKNKSADVKSYAFKFLGDEFPHMVFVSIVERNKRGVLSSDRVLVRIDCKWRPIKEWLREVMPYAVKSEWSDLERQQIWWDNMRKHKGKCFPVMSLPKDVRLELYQHILGSFIYPHSQSVRLMDSTSDWAYHDLVVLGHNANCRIFRGNKQMRREAMDAGWVGTTKYFKDSDCFRHIMWATPPPKVNWLTKIHLDFGMNQHFAMLGVYVNPGIHINADLCAGPLLKEIKSLKDLTLEFPDPYKDHHNHLRWNPWSAWIYHMGTTVQNHYQGMREWPCANTMTDWILTFAYPHIKHIPNIRLVGYIKTVVKAKWMRLLNNEYAQRKLSVEDKKKYATVFDHEAALAAILELPVNTHNLQVHHGRFCTYANVFSPPPCRCRLPCYRDMDFQSTEYCFKGLEHHYDGFCTCFDHDDKCVPESEVEAEQDAKEIEGEDVEEDAEEAAETATEEDAEEEIKEVAEESIGFDITVLEYSTTESGF